MTASISSSNQKLACLITFALTLVLTACNNEPTPVSTDAAADSAQTDTQLKNDTSASSGNASPNVDAPINEQDLANAQIDSLDSATIQAPSVSQGAGVIGPAPTNKTFGITPATFGQRLDTAAESVGLTGGVIGDFDIKQGKVNDSFAKPLSDAIAMTGTVDKNGELKSIIYIMGPSNNDAENENELMNMAMVAGLTARTLNPNTDEKQTGGKIIELLNQSLDDFAATGEGANNAVINGVRYFSVVNPDTGIWLGFEPA